MSENSSINRRFGYARVSTKDQNLHLQKDALIKAGIAEEDIFEETGSGKSASARPKLNECLRMLRPGDTLVVWRLDRLGRSLVDLIKIVSELQAKGVFFESLTERIETISAGGKLIFHVFASLAEFERNLLMERTEAGLQAARARGRNGGRPSKLTPQQVREIRLLMADRNTVASDIARRYGVSRATLYKYCSQAQE